MTKTVGLAEVQGQWCPSQGNLQMPMVPFHAETPPSITHTSHSCSQSSGGASLPFMLCGQFPLQKWKGLVFAIWVQRTETAPLGKLRSLKPEDRLRTQDLQREWGPWKVWEMARRRQIWNSDKVCLNKLSLM